MERSLYDAVGGIEIFYQLNNGRFVEHLSDDWDFGIKVIAYGGKPVYARHAYVEINSRRVDTILDEVINGIAYGKDGIIIMKDVRPDVEQQKTVLADATPAEAKLAWDYSVKDYTPKNILLPVLLNPYLLLENSEVRDFFSGPLADRLYRRIHELKHEMRIIDFKPIHAYKTPPIGSTLSFAMRCLPPCAAPSVTISVSRPHCRPVSTRSTTRISPALFITSVKTASPAKHITISVMEGSSDE
ncbi:hypothetical protein M5585_16955 [Serratia ureilytica]